MRKLIQCLYTGIRLAEFVFLEVPGLGKLLRDRPAQIRDTGGGSLAFLPARGWLVLRTWCALAAAPGEADL